MLLLHLKGRPSPSFVGSFGSLNAMRICGYMDLNVALELQSHLHIAVLDNALLYLKYHDELL